MRRHWLTLDTAIGPVEVYVKKHCFNGSDACYSFRDARIDVCENKSKHFMRLSLFHEMVHVLWRGYTGDVLRSLFGKRFNFKKREEALTGSLEPLYDLMRRNGMIRFPDPPRLPKRKKGRKKR